MLDFTKKEIGKKKEIEEVATPWLGVKEGFLEMACSLRPKSWVAVNWIKSQGKSRLGRGTACAKAQRKNGRVSLSKVGSRERESGDRGRGLSWRATKGYWLEWEDWTPVKGRGHVIRSSLRKISWQQCGWQIGGDERCWRTGLWWGRQKWMDSSGADRCWWLIGGKGSWGRGKTCVDCRASGLGDECMVMRSSEMTKEGGVQVQGWIVAGVQPWACWVWVSISQLGQLDTRV